MKKVRVPWFFGLHARPGPIFGRLLGIIPIAFLVFVYISCSHKRHIENPSDKLMPTVSQMYTEMKQIMTIPDKRSGQIFFWADTKASLRRLGIGVGISAIIGYMLGVGMGMFPGFRALLLPTITGISNINPLALLVIILVFLGVGESSKIFLIVFGVGIPISRSVQKMVENMPNELTVKALTLGASQGEVITRVVTPQVLPQLIELVRVSLGAAWIFVIAAEAIASTEGLGYRIYLQQRYMNMALIIPYVIYITLVAFSIDYGLQILLRKCFRWYSSSSN
ncbi:MAG: ABC transporter permease subunit [Candidatus Paceibacterota bacterium]|jgi:NitT/TauT family transport system permease protein